MATWDELDIELESEKDDEEANMALMATTTFNADSEVDSDDYDEVFSELTGEEMVNAIKELLSRFLNK